MCKSTFVPHASNTAGHKKKEKKKKRSLGRLEPERFQDALALDVDVAALDDVKVSGQKLVALVRYLNATRLARRAHPRRHVDGVAEQMIVRTIQTDQSAGYRTCTSNQPALNLAL